VTFPEVRHREGVRNFGLAPNDAAMGRRAFVVAFAGLL